MYVVSLYLPPRKIKPRWKNEFKICIILILKRNVKRVESKAICEIKKKCKGVWKLFLNLQKWKENIFFHLHVQLSIRKISQQWIELESELKGKYFLERWWITQGKWGGEKLNGDLIDFSKLFFAVLVENWAEWWKQEKKFTG